LKRQMALQSYAAQSSLELNRLSTSDVALVYLIEGRERESWMHGSSYQTLNHVI